jgi:phosphatidyl-myo-inositol dimannoside synthase
MSRIVFIASDYKPWPGGIAEYLDTLARGLIDLGHTVTVLAVVAPEEKDRIQFLQTYESWVIPFPMSLDPKPANWLGRKFVSLLEILRSTSPALRKFLGRAPLFASSTASIRELRAILAEKKPDTVIFGHLDVKLYPLALFLLDQKLPYVIIAHDSEIRHVANNGRSDLTLRGMMLRGARWVVANSRHTKELMEVWNLAPDQVKIVFPPISQDACDESAIRGRDVPRDDRFTLVTICRLVRGKGIDIVLQALSILETRGIPYRYLIGGDGPERKPLEALANSLGVADKVEFKGSVAGEAKWRLLRTGDVFVTPSRVDPSVPWQEGFGIAFVEAAAFGLPAVASTSGGIPDAVVDGETGILVPEESPAELADALALLYREPEKRVQMGKVARERARNQFSPRAIATRFQEDILDTAR